MREQKYSMILGDIWDYHESTCFLSKNQHTALFSGITYGSVVEENENDRVRKAANKFG